MRPFCTTTSLDAAKAYDKLWRDGLFYKMISKSDKLIWRILVNYYRSRKIIICVDGLKSEPFRTDEGCKQGGILSSYLFNYFIDDLLTGLQNLGVGATVGNFNNSVMAYCDDIVLLVSNEAYMNRLLNFCYRYSCLWKMEFNPNKSLAYSSNNSPNTFVMNGIKIPQVKGFIYLGLPIPLEIKILLNNILVIKWRKSKNLFIL
jgi:hypothetical protein